MRILDDIDDIAYNNVGLPTFSFRLIDGIPALALNTKST
jgi:hypothetical protein